MQRLKKKKCLKRKKREKKQKRKSRFLRAVIGLGNPGKRYRKTRHNLGFRVVDMVQSGFDGVVGEVRGMYWAKTSDSAQDRFFFVKPLAFMNRSGPAVREFVEEHGLVSGELLVVCDDIYLALGKARLRRKGSSGGHKGLESIIESLGTKEFPRLRIGIGPVDGDADLVEFVLSEFTDDEENTLEGVLGAASGSVVAFLEKGLDTAVDRLNESLTVPGKKGVID
ncbi:MAG: aminoacyl-tRNA hydrolase [Candidatus Eisenbacteria bacterium]|nr:aminoacyl-tRNA hydrolase [Candidatus Eisenbacteria bacterium]